MRIGVEDRNFGMQNLTDFHALAKRTASIFHDLNIEQIYLSIYLCAMSFDVGDYVSPSPSIL